MPRKNRKRIPSSSVHSPPQGHSSQQYASIHIARKPPPTPEEVAAFLGSSQGRMDLSESGEYSRNQPGETVEKDGAEDLSPPRSLHLPFTANHVSWTWSEGDIIHGRRVRIRKKMFWECAHCPYPGRPKRYATTGGTKIRLEHLRRAHGVVQRKIKPKVTGSKSSSGTGPDCEQGEESVSVQNTILDARVIKDLLVQMVVYWDVPVIALVSEDFKNLIRYISKPAVPLVPTSISAAKGLIMRAYKLEKSLLANCLQNAISPIHFTIDFSHCLNKISFVTVTAHFTNEEGALDQAMLCFKEINGGNTGKNLASILISQFEEYKIMNKMGHGMMKLSARKAAMCSAIEAHQKASGARWDAEENQLQCIRHVLNLSIKSFLVIPPKARGLKGYNGDTGEQLKEWTLAPPLRKAQNLTAHIRDDKELQAEFERRSGAPVPHKDNDTEWPSWYCFIQSILRPRIRESLDFYASQTQPEKEGLSDKDWTIVQLMADFLGPIKDVTARIEGSDSTLIHAIPAIDYLIDYYSSSLEAYRDHTFFVYMIKLGLQELKPYSDLMECSSAYIAAVVLNPAWKWDYFHSRWSHPRIEQAKKKVHQYWEQFYRPVSTSRNITQLSNDSPLAFGSHINFEKWSRLDYAVVANDEYAEYCASPSDAAITNPREYWMLQTSLKYYPNLSKMALDILSIPAMSGERGRSFPAVGRTIIDGNNGLADGTIEALECLKSWDRCRV